MKYTVIRLLKNGLKLSREELESAERHTGNFIVDDWLEGGIFRRPVQRARLLSMAHGPAYDLLPPLFEPGFLKVTETRIALRGIEILVEDGVGRQVAQEWMLKPAAYEEEIK